MAHTVAVGEFEGPLGLLLELVQRGKIEVSSISVADVTAKYLASLEALEVDTPEELSEFLGLGARLVYIKSLALLPQEASVEQGEELRILNLELAEYKRMQSAARELGQRSSTRSWPRTMTERLPRHDMPLPDIDITQLSDAFTRALKRTAPSQPTRVIRRHISMEAVSKRLKRNLESGQFELQGLLDSCHDRLEIIVTFLALLELIRSGMARVIQAGQFAPILVEAASA